MNARVQKNPFERAERYLERAIGSATDTVAAGAPGERNNVLFRNVAAIAGLHTELASRGVPVPSAASIHQQIVSAARRAGMLENRADRAAFQTTWEYGWRAGCKSPRRRLPDGLIGNQDARVATATAPGPDEMPTLPEFDPVPQYRPQHEVNALWDGCRRADGDPEVVGWLQSRGLDARTIADLDLARALPRGARVPGWAASPQGFAWPESGHRLIVPLYDAAGVLRGFNARAIRLSEHKSLGTLRVGLVMASRVALYTLRYELIDRVQLPDVVVTEGEPDFLSACVAWARNDERAIFGVFTGAWSPAIGARIPPGSKVIVHTHHDAAGDRYAQRIASTLKHCRCFRAGIAK